MSAALITTGSVPSPTALRLLADLGNEDVEIGSDAGRWRVVSVSDTFLYVEVQIGDSASYVGIRIDYADYPATAPAGVVWDVAADTPLAIERWPVGSLAETVFRKDWSVANGGALYAPWDRVAIPGHPDWPAAHPGKIWNPSRSIAHYLRETRRVLESASLPVTELPS